MKNKLKSVLFVAICSLTFTVTASAQRDADRPRAHDFSVRETRSELSRSISEGAARASDINKGERHNSGTGIHSHGNGWGGLRLGGRLEPAGFYREGTIGVGVGFHWGGERKSSSQRDRTPGGSDRRN